MAIFPRFCSVRKYVFLPMDRPTDQLTETPSYKDVWMHLKKYLQARLRNSQTDCYSDLEILLYYKFIKVTKHTTINTTPLQYEYY